jgi:hypothetical protein
LPWQINSTLIIFLYLHLSLVFLLKSLIFHNVINLKAEDIYSEMD